MKKETFTYVKEFFNTYSASNFKGIWGTIANCFYNGFLWNLGKMKIGEDQQKKLELQNKITDINFSIDSDNKVLTISRLLKILKKKFHNLNYN